LQAPGHPFRQLLNRIATLSTSVDETSSSGSQLRQEVTRAVEHVLREFHSDVSLIDAVLNQLNLAAAVILRSGDPEAATAVEAVEAAACNPEQFDIALNNTVSTLRERLVTLQTDQRAADFIIGFWSRVLVHVSQHGELDPKPYLDAIPELIWSVQCNLDAGERGALMRLLPKLAARLREGLALIKMPEAESRKVLDGLVAMHAQALRSMPDPAQHAMRLGSLIQHFASLKIGGADETVTALYAPAIAPERLQASLRRFGANARAWADGDVGSLTKEDAMWLGAMQPGTAVEWWADAGYLPARLMWVEEARSFYLFRIDPARRIEGEPGLLIYSSISLIKAMREGSIGLIEPVPIFDRAIESLLGDDAQPALEDLA
jgi:hypothetical protein